jgi:aspartyl-tRNA(Asn)/glutamyl-tRNA(Gln) amidotransferase subunit A
MTPTERVLRSREAIERLDPLLNACISTRFDAAWAEAEELERGAVRGPMHGWTVVVKDNMDVAGTVRTDGLRPPHPAPAARDAAGVGRLRDAGAIVLAKANLEELSFGATTQNAYWGRCRNPWDTARVPGGSSGGCAVAVAVGMADIALGTDTGGSVRNPAALCGVTALRPSAGAVPCGGVTPLSPSYDTVGPFARNAEQLRVAMEVLSGRALSTAPGDLRCLRVGVPSAFFFDGLDADVAQGCDELLAMLAAAGAQVRRVELPGASEARAAGSVLMTAEAAELNRSLRDDSRIDAQVRDRLSLGAGASANEHAAARAVALRWTADVLHALEQVDVLMSPAVPLVAPTIDGTHLDDMSRRISRCSIPWSLARVPALALPLHARDLPVGAQLVGAPGRDALLVGVAEAIQACTDWHLREPPARAEGISTTDCTTA